jgi:hypothetical protein
MACSLAPKAATRPPSAKIEVEAKNAAPFCRLPMMLVGEDGITDPAQPIEGEGEGVEERDVGQGEVPGSIRTAGELIPKPRDIDLVRKRPLVCWHLAIREP